MPTIDILDAIWNLLQPLLNDQLKERLKPASSEVRAKKLIFAVYRHLGILEKCSGNFVESLSKVYELGSSEGSIDELRTSTSNLVAAMESFSKAFGQVQTQLEIHNEPLVTGFYGYTHPRGTTIDKASTIAEWTVMHALSAKSKEVSSVLESVKSNHEKLAPVTRKFRAFLAAEFSFKESF